MMASAQPVSNADTDDVAAVVALLRGTYARWTRTTTIQQMRDDWDELFRGRAQPWPIERIKANGVAAEWIAAEGARVDRVILYLHGGGFRLGSIDSHRDLMQRLSVATGARVLGIDYRLAPEHMFPAPVEDALAAYRWLLEAGVPPGCIAFAGDSAGGGLALSCLFAARTARLPLPCAAYLMSPWTDLAATGASFVSRADVDPLHQRPMILSMAKAYLAPSGDPLDPLASPLYGDVGGLPPLLIQCGDCETILDDSVRLAECARNAGVNVELEIYPAMIHVFQAFGELSAAQRALAAAGSFLKRHFLKSDPQKVAATGAMVGRDR
jgi:epsilon-lactone hydrolase